MSSASDLIVVARKDGSIGATGFAAKFSRRHLILPTTRTAHLMIMEPKTHEELEITTFDISPSNRAVDDDEDDNNPAIVTLSQTQLALLASALAIGANQAKINVESRLNGTVSIPLSIYFWNEQLISRKLVISDIDGTVTKSDLRGHILKEKWIHNGVTELYMEIAKRGYQFIYLSARPLRFVESTRETIRDCNLPIGPVIVSVSGTASSMVREVIRKEQLVNFKVSTLLEIFKVVSSTGLCPFTVGLGNRETDSRCYQVAGIDQDHVLLIDENELCCSESGKIKCVGGYSELCSNLQFMDSLFPK